MPEIFLNKNKIEDFLQINQEEYMRGKLVLCITKNSFKFLDKKFYGKEID